MNEQDLQEAWNDAHHMPLDQWLTKYQGLSVQQSAPVATVGEPFGEQITWLGAVPPKGTPLYTHPQK